jgi:hypothetical protein
MSWRWWFAPPCLLRVVIVNLKSSDDSALRGVLWTSRGPWLVLRDCTGLKEGKPPVPIDGEVVIARDNVAFIQVFP